MEISLVLMIFVINNIVILANYFIHKCRFFNNLLFQQDLMIFFKSLKIMRSEKALKLCGLLKVFLMIHQLTLVLHYLHFYFILFFLFFSVMFILFICISFVDLLF